MSKSLIKDLQDSLEEKFPNMQVKILDGTIIGDMFPNDTDEE